VNPVVDWIWFGFMLLAIGTAIALIPDSVLDRLTGRGPMAGFVLWLAVGAAAGGLVPGLGERAAHAQGAAPAANPQMAITDLQPPSPKGADENWLVRNIICQCGSCRHNLLECESDGCAYGARERIEIHNLLAQGKTRQDVIQYYITKYGSQIALAAPIDKGFNRLAWGLPYGLGAVAAGLLGLGAYRLSHRRGPPPPPAGPPGVVDDQELKDKLDDELRDLD